MKTPEELSVCFLSVGQGNMVVIQTPSGGLVVYDCCLTDENAVPTLDFLQEILGRGRGIDVFIGSHPDPQHVGGVQLLDERFPIAEVWTYGGNHKGVDPRWLRYLRLPRADRVVPLRPGEVHNAAGQAFYCLNAAGFSQNGVDDASLVLHTEFREKGLLLTGDTSCEVWRKAIVPHTWTRLRSDVVLASHHGSDRFFYAGNPQAYVSHLNAIRPALVVVSVAPGLEPLPDPTALNLYSYYTRGMDGVSIVRTDELGHILYSVNGRGDESLISIEDGFITRLAEVPAA